MVQLKSDSYNAFAPFLSDSEKKRLLSVLRSVAVKGGERLFTTGDAAAEVYFLIAGRLAVQKFTGFGNRTQVVGLLDPGAPVGEAGILKGQQRDATVAAIVDSELLSLARSDFDKLSVGDTDLSIKLLKWLLSRTSLRLKKSSERLAYIL